MEIAETSGATHALQVHYDEASGVGAVSARSVRAGHAEIGVQVGTEELDWEEEARLAREAVERLRGEVTSLRAELSKATVRAGAAEASVEAANEEQQRLAARVTEREAELDQLRAEWLSATRESQALAQERDAARLEAREAVWAAQRAKEEEEAARGQLARSCPASSPMMTDVAVGTMGGAGIDASTNTAQGSPESGDAQAHDELAVRGAVAASEAAAASREQALCAHVRELGSLLEESRRELARLRYAAGEEELPGASTVVISPQRRREAGAELSRSLADADPASRSSPPLYEVGNDTWGSPLLVPNTPAEEAWPAKSGALTREGAGAEVAKRDAAQAGDEEEGARAAEALRQAEAKGREEGRKVRRAETCGAGRMCARN